MSDRTVKPQEWGKIFAKAWTDPQFEHLLRTDPTAAVKQALGVDPGTTLNMFNVPPRPADLTDEQLEAVHAGTANIQIPYCC